MDKLRNYWPVHINLVLSETNEQLQSVALQTMMAAARCAKAKLISKDKEHTSLTFFAAVPLSFRTKVLIVTLLVIDRVLSAIKSQDNSASNVTVYGLDDQGSIPGVEELSLCHNVQTDCGGGGGGHSPLSRRYRVISLAVKLNVCSAKIKNAALSTLRSLKSFSTPAALV